jgi:hypothetical protein
MATCGCHVKATMARALAGSWSFRFPFSYLNAKRVALETQRFWIFWRGERLLLEQIESAPEEFVPINFAVLTFSYQNQASPLGMQSA